MITLFLLLGVLTLLAIALLAYQVRNAPVGHEDSEGFHYEAELLPGHAPHRSAGRVITRSNHGSTRQAPAV